MEDVSMEMDVKKPMQEADAIVALWEQRSKTMSREDSILDQMQNIVLLGGASHVADEVACRVVDNLYQAKLIPFQGNSPGIFFKMNYSPGTDRQFTSIQYLVEALMLEAGYKGQYRGCLVLDITEWLGHEKEYYFDVLLSYLSDLSDDVYTIFQISRNRDKETMEMEEQMELYFDLTHIQVKKQERGRFGLVKEEGGRQHA